MTAKRKIVLMSVFLFIAIIMLTSSILFNVKIIEVNILGTSGNFETVKEQVAEHSQIKKGSNIFFVNTTKAKDSIEKNMPQLKVENKIYRKFPNKIIIDVSVRKTLFYIKEDTASTTNFYILDGELKVLQDYKDHSTNPAPELIELKGVGATGTEAGDFINSPLVLNFLNCNLQVVENQRLNLLSEFKTVEKNGNDIILCTRITDCKITIINAGSNTFEKFSALGFLSSVDVLQYQGRDIIIDFANGNIIMLGFNS